MSSNVEQPTYEIIKKEGNIEQRRYPSLIAAQVTVEGERKEAISAGFKILADFIFGNNESNEKVSMTAPVEQSLNEEIAMTAPVTQNTIGEDRWQVRFFMPSQYTLQSLPKPNDPRVKIVTLPQKNVLVIQFSGRTTQDNLDKHLDKLNAYIKQHTLKVSGEPSFAFYNPPWTLPLLRRNEIMYTLQH